MWYFPFPGKMDRLNKLWNSVREGTKHRGKSLEDALELAERFWDELQNVMQSLKDLQVRYYFYYWANFRAQRILKLWKY